MSGEHLKLHLNVIQAQAVSEIERSLNEDEDLEKEDLVEAQETAGFHDRVELRQAIGSHFNHLFFWNILANEKDITVKEPTGKLAEFINKYFTDFNGFKESFKKVAMTRVQPGWVWLGLTKDHQLVITQTNNEDNTLMHGIALVQCTPVIGLDLWEHAYFTQYQGDKEQYVDTFWRFVNWEKVSDTFEKFNINGNKVGPLIE